MRIRFEKKDGYTYIFSFDSGQSITLEKTSFFMRDEGPNLLDVSITNRCDRGCDFCYRQSTVFGNDMSMEAYKTLLSEARECGVQQIALGGGEPTLHPDFCEILRVTWENGIIPNYSTNGDNLTDRIICFTKKYCGAIAISVYEDISKYEDIVYSLSKYGITVNLHFILRSDRVEEYISFLKSPPYWMKNVNAIIFLNYKPANGNELLCLKNVDEHLLKEFFNAISEYDVCGVGFDTCSVSFICQYLNVDDALYDFCEAARKSAYINERLEVFPCSFYTNGGNSLKERSLKNIWWDSNVFKNHREGLKCSEQNCARIEMCRGGCPIYSINCCGY